jgi:copper chaperone CopZ
MEQTTTLKIDGMTCAHCAVHIEKALEALPGVVEASVTLDRGATVRHNGVAPEEMQRAVCAAGEYRAEVVS